MKPMRGRAVKGGEKTGRKAEKERRVNSKRGILRKRHIRGRDIV